MFLLVLVKFFKYFANIWWPVHSLLFFVEIERFALRAAILHECQNNLAGEGGLGGDERNRGTVISCVAGVERGRG